MMPLLMLHQCILRLIFLLSRTYPEMVTCTAILRFATEAVVNVFGVLGSRPELKVKGSAQGHTKRS